ncbi:unnamed protein product [Paramecium sonneborni]|uniref:Pentapeptide repeat-containing protein n=1 Tax=Paramecium sonneborni TaxID=65129 RepID=A0A8S1RN61_9CILI|nr:unnamed protein product [Paramecium sonneborni]
MWVKWTLLNSADESRPHRPDQSLEDIRIKYTSFIGANFVRCNFSGSELENVDISGVNLNGALLFNCKQKNIKIHELNKLDGLTSDAPNGM